MEQLDPTPISAEEFYEKISNYLTPRQVEFVREAYNFAAEKHAAQKRASGEPYIIHPLGVATILAQLQMDDVTLAAAFLHDVVEDTDVTLDQLSDIFGLEVAGLVDGVTKLGKIEYISREEQQIENYRKMFLAMAKDIRVVLIKLADRLHNMRTMKYMPVHKQKRISSETLEIYAPLAHRLGIYAIKWELEDLSFRYLEPQHYYELVEEVKIKRHEREAMVQEAMDELRHLCSDAGIRCEIQGRPKSFYSIYKKMQRDNKTINEIYDLLAVRVLVDSVKDCGISYEKPRGGVYVWCRLPEGLDCKEFVKEAYGRDLLLIPGYIFYPFKNGGRDRVRICYSFEKKDKLEEGMKIFNDMIREIAGK